MRGERVPMEKDAVGECLVISDINSRAATVSGRRDGGERTHHRHIHYCTLGKNEKMNSLC